MIDIDINDLVVGRSYYFWMNGEEHLSELVNMTDGQVEMANGYVCSISDFLTSAEISDVSPKPNFSDVRFNGGESDEFVPNIKLDHNGVPIIPKSAMDMEGMSDLIDTDFDEPIAHESKKTKKKLNVSLSEKLKKSPCTLSLNLTIPDKETVNTICNLMTIEKSEMIESIFNDIYDQIDESVKTAINNFYE